MIKRTPLAHSMPAACISVNAILPYTSGSADDFQFAQWITVSSATKLVFRVRACNDAHLALSAIPGAFTTQAYQVCIFMLFI